jgi:hypothetical protein
VAKLALAVVVVLLFPPAAAAHLRTGTVAVDYRARIGRAPTGPVSVGVYQSDRALHLTVARGHRAVVFGYLGEPFVRVGSSGVTVERSSPTAAAARVTVHGRSVVWHDVRTSRARWTVPVVVDGRRETIAGVTQRLRKPSLALWFAIAAALGLAAAATRSAVAAGLAAATAAAVAAAGFALSLYASPGTWIAGLDELVFLVAGVAVLRLGPPPARMPAAGWLGLVAVAVGLSKGEVFLHALVLSAVPGTITRVLAAAAVGGGLAAVGLAGASYLR